MNKLVVLRNATPSDAEQILNIYSYYIKHTAITFEYDIPSLDEFQGRIQKTLERYPYIVAEKNGKILGYAYAGAFVGRAAYNRSAELSIYLDKDCRRMGIGKLLYGELEKRLKELGILNLYACIGYTENEDEYLNKNSMQFHSHLGFETVGTFRNCGCKFGRWYDMIWMEKIIGEHTAFAAAKSIF